MAFKKDAQGAVLNTRRRMGNSEANSVTDVQVAADSLKIRGVN